VQPRGERVTGRVGDEQLVGQRLELLDPVAEHGLHQVVARGEVAVQRADADAGAARDVLQRRAGVVLGERLAGGGDQRVVIATRVGALRAPRRELGGGGGVGGHGRRETRA